MTVRSGIIEILAGAPAVRTSSLTTGFPPLYPTARSVPGA